MIGAGIGLTAIAALGTYLLYGKRGEKNREIIAGWMLKLKGEVLEKVEEIKEINEAEYYKIVDEVTARYSRLGKVGAGELKRLKEDLRDAWKHLSKELQ
ncbi:MAG: hypothetical protein A3J79_08680 [Elusimicrobia bacterium RIFOXYB2_FULL_62_6]|nr:MAG: hypothetical protein A3J79_08680 [Elusimicrobia bacterium RIFOXYB2_FULL_62_6]